MYAIGFAVLATFVIFLIACVVTHFQNTAFNKRFPALSDQEFIAKLDPGISPKIALKVRKVLSDALGVDYERIHPQASLIKDLGAE
jgi:hypothetical protein